MDEFLSGVKPQIGAFLSEFGLKIIGAAILLLIGIRLIKFLQKLILKSKSYKKLSGGAQIFIRDISKIILYVLLAVSIASALGIPTASILAVIGSAGLAIGLALQGSLSNLAGGFMILLFKPFIIGDYIETDKYSGTVADIGIFYTTLLTVDNKKITVPNGVCSNREAINYSAYQKRRIDLEILVAYDSCIDLVKETLYHVAEAHEIVLKDPAPLVVIGKHAESGLVFFMQVWVKTDNYLSAKYEMLEAVKKEFARHGITIPFTTFNVYIGNL